MESRIRRVVAASFVAASMIVSAPAFALTSVTPTDLSGLSTSSVESLLKTTAIAAEHRAYAPATALGVMLGLDIGADVTYLSLPTDFANALAAASGQSTSQLPSGLVLPKLNVHKGLPMGIDLGATFMTLSSGGSKVFSTYGGELKWAFINNAALPAVAVRTSYSKHSVYFVDASTFDLEATVSKNLMIIDPYVGLGYQRWSGSLNVPAALSSQLSANGVSPDASGNAFKFYGGLQLKLGFIKIAGQADYSTAGMTTFGGKFSFGF